MKNDFYNDGEWECGDCDGIFKVYQLGDQPDVNFCPLCGSRDIKEIELEE